MIFDNEEKALVQIIKTNNRAKLFADKEEAVHFIKKSKKHIKALHSWVKENELSLSSDDNFLDKSCTMISRAVSCSDIDNEYRASLLNDPKEEVRNATQDLSFILSEVIRDNNLRSSSHIAGKEALEAKFDGMMHSISLLVILDTRGKVRSTTEKKEASSWRRHLDSPPKDRTIKPRALTTGDEDMGRK